MVKNYKFFKQTNANIRISDKRFGESTQDIFKDLSSSYSDFLHSIFDNDERGNLIGFRFVRRFVKS